MPDGPSGWGAARLDSIMEILGKTRRSAPARPALVLIAMGTDEVSGSQSIVAAPALGRIRDSRVTFHGVSFDRTPSDLFRDASTHSGGRWLALSDVNRFAAALSSIGDDLSAQYLVTYALPDGVKPSNRLEVTLNRPGATLRAPTRVAR